MQNYIPPYTISNKMLELVSEISEKIGKINSHRELESRPHLRRNNRIQSIHSSLKIEAYEHIPDINPFSITDLKKIHGIMTYRTVNESGIFRKGDEGVFSGDTCIFVAPPPQMVDNLMNDLFTWMKKSEGVVHPLILSAVFHYEFVFIHPFADGNGRMARLWHTAILYRWRNVFEYIPLESQIEKYQAEYYDAIAQCHVNGNSDNFIEFMLEMIWQILDEVIAQIRKSDSETSEYVKRILDVMEYDIPYTSNAIMQALGLRSKETLRKNYINPAIELGVIRMTLPDKPNSKNQRYVKQ